MAKYGVVAVGGNRTHLEGYSRSFAADPRVELIAVADEDGLSDYREGLNRILASELGVPYLSLDEALARDDVHIVCSCADIERRGSVASKAVRAGKHIYLDKPLAGTLEDAKLIADEAEAAGVVNQMFSQVNTTWAMEAKRALDGGGVGPLRAIHCDMLMAKGKPGTVSPDLVRKERSSDGKFTFVTAKRELFDMGVYPIALVTWLTGQRVKTVYGITGNLFFKEHASHDIEDYGALVLTLEDGTVASISSGRIGATSHPRSGQQRITMIGDGISTFGEDESYIEVFNDEPPFVMPTVHPFDPMSMWSSTDREIQSRPKNRRLPLKPSPGDGDIRAFLDCVENGTTPEITARDAQHHVEVILAGYESAASGKPVDL
ncbi:MAG: Gfo/Idh/MocA family oxidoreductase [Chloroflexi bacterium]|nr:Gfo/Idh/MocA family oxidoreductase [Chloroflexota bacterium]